MIFFLSLNVFNDKMNEKYYFYYLSGITCVVHGNERFFRSIDDGIVICFSDEHSTKTLCPIEVTDDGIMISVSDEHLAKAAIPIEVTDDGIVISVSDEHSEKAKFPIDFIDDGIMICVSDLQ